MLEQRYFVAFDLKGAKVRVHFIGRWKHPASWKRPCYRLIESVFRNHGYEKDQDSVYKSRPNGTRDELESAFAELNALPWFRDGCKNLLIVHGVQLPSLLDPSDMTNVQ